jgi:hypothetical protein
MCWNILPNTTELPESGEWISAQLVGAWYRVQLPKAFKMTKVMIEQRSWENSQIKEVAIKFDEGASLKVCLSLVLYHLKMNGFSLNVDYVFLFFQMTLTQNINGVSAALDAKKFASRSSTTVTFTILSMHTDNGLMNSGSYVLPGFKKIQIYDEDCDRGNYQTPND